MTCCSGHKCMSFLCCGWPCESLDFLLDQMICRILNKCASFLHCGWAYVPPICFGKSLTWNIAYIGVYLSSWLERCYPFNGPEQTGEGVFVQRGKCIDTFPFCWRSFLKDVPYDMIFTKMTEISWLCYKAIIMFFSPFLDWPLCAHWSFLDNFWVLCNCSEWSKAIKTGPPREARNRLEESLRPQYIHGVHLYMSSK